MSKYYESLQSSAQIILDAHDKGCSDEQIIQIYRKHIANLMGTFPITLTQADADLTQTIQQNGTCESV